MAVHLLPKQVLKELADNALDAGGTVRVGQLQDGGWYVEDDAPGIAGDPPDIARLFSIRRPLVSSKLLRLPTRGALGNGLRVVAGAVLIAWLDDKMAAFGNGKLAPARVLAAELSETLEGRLQRQITEQILREARIVEKLVAALQEIDPPMPGELHTAIGGALLDQPEASWRTAIERVADQLLASQDGADGSPESGP